MKKIKDYVEKINDEINGAKEYIEKALWYKAKGDANRYTKYKEMSIQELGHAMTIHQFAAEDIEELKRVYPDVPMNQQHFLTFRLSLLHLFEKDCFLFLIL